MKQPPQEKFSIATHPTPVVVRHLSPSDSIPELTQLLHRSYKTLADLGLNYVATYQSDDITADRLAKSLETFVAVHEDNLVGTISLYRPDDVHGCRWYLRPEVAHFSQFGVQPEYQGVGLGSEMLRIVERAAGRMDGITELALDTSVGAAHLIAFYEKRGYRVVDHVDWEITNYRSVILSKRVGG